MYYDDGYEFKNVSVEKGEKPEGYVRAYQLSNGDVVNINNLLLEFEDNILYEVVKVRETLFEPKYERTGKSFTPEQINKIIK